MEKRGLSKPQCEDQQYRRPLTSRQVFFEIGHEDPLLHNANGRAADCQFPHDRFRSFQTQDPDRLIRMLD